MPNTDLGTKSRIESIDILRGLVMLIMAIDHVRDALHRGHPSPTDLAMTTPLLFFTRWITHFCAPTFVFLSGISGYLAGMRRSAGEQALFLVKRGIWLLIVEVLVVSFAITLNPYYSYIILQVIWAIGGSMILLGLLIRLRASPLLIGIIGFVIFAGHNVFDILSDASTNKTIYWQLLVSGNGWDGQIPINKDHVINVPYPLLPWTGVMLMGYAIGPIFKSTFNTNKRKNILLYSGLGMLALFFIFRAFNIYGDPTPWSVQKTVALTVISFFNVTKYPCSLLYLCMTLGVALIILNRMENVKNKFTSVLTVYGSVPFFYYIGHWYLIQLVAIMLFFFMGYPASQIVTPGNPFLFTPNDFGLDLAGVYVLWVMVVVSFYWPCKWFSIYKKTHRQWWLSYV